ncbi:MAG: alpha/beta hydrolase [Kordiimonadaceae bacterium]|nr:alpha/beta hydrolase [Kordiimonadaceae bacterium]
MTISSKFKTIVVAIVLGSFSSFGAAGADGSSEPKAYEIPRSQVVPIKDTATDRQYELYIRLPSDYAKTADIKHPVVYTTDAAWHMEMLSGAAEYMLPNSIVVAISWQKDSKDDFGGDERPHRSRNRDYTFIPAPTPELQAKYKDGEARNHLTFIRNDVIKYVEANYQTDPAERIYFGFSLGGLFGSYILFEEPDTFKHYVLGSPAFGPRDLTFLQDLAAKREADGTPLDANVYVSVGEKETDAIPLIQTFMSTLQRHKGAGLNPKELEVVEQSGHSEAFPATAVRSFKWLSDLMAENSAGE